MCQECLCNDQIKSFFAGIPKQYPENAQIRNSFRKNGHCVRLFRVIMILFSVLFASAWHHYNLRQCIHILYTYTAGVYAIALLTSCYVFVLRIVYFPHFCPHPISQIACFSPWDFLLHSVSLLTTAMVFHSCYLAIVPDYARHEIFLGVIGDGLTWKKNK